MQDLGLSPGPVELESALYQDPQMTHKLKVSEVLSKLLFFRHTEAQPTIHMPTEKTVLKIHLCII